MSVIRKFYFLDSGEEAQNLKNILSNDFVRLDRVKFDLGNLNIAEYPENAVIGKVSKVGDIQRPSASTSNSIRIIELYEVSQNLIVKESSPKLILELCGKLAYKFGILTHNHFIILNGFEVKSATFIDPDYIQQKACSIPSSLLTCFANVGSIKENMEQPLECKSQICRIKISDLKPRVESAFYGVVHFVGKEKTSTGSHRYSKLLTVVDESWKKLQCMLFSSRLSAYPSITKNDIVRISNSKIGIFNGNLQAAVRNVNDILVFNTDQRNFVINSSDTLASISGDDLVRVEMLRRWINECCPNRCSLTQVERDVETFDLLCQVISVYVCKEINSIYLHVWDGTALPNFLQSTTTSNQNAILHQQDEVLSSKCHQMKTLVCIEGLNLDNFKIKPCDYIMLNRLKLVRVLGGQGYSTLRTEKYIINMQYSPTKENVTVYEPPQQFIENLCQVEGITESDLLPKEVAPVQPNEPGIFEDDPRLSLHPSIVSVSKYYGNIMYSTINEIKKAKCPNKFHLLAKVIDYSPKMTPDNNIFTYKCPNCANVYLNKTIEVMIKKETGLHECPSCASSNSKGNFTLQVKLAMRFTLKDGTGTLQAILWDKNADLFFNGNNKLEIMEANQTVYKNKISQFLNTIDSSNDDIKFDCCLMSYDTVNGTRYQIFDTSLL